MGFERAFEVTPLGMKIGSRADADVRIGIPGIPPQACVLSYQNTDLVITEINNNSVQIDGQPAHDGEVLNHGCVLSVGPANFTIELG